jgi:YidC/Oxa1 family membrane protein insertase
MPNILYTLIIFPIEQLIELCYALILRLTHSPGLSIIGLSMAVSTLILPIYLMAEKKQKAEREKQKQMKGKIDKIKAVFKGDERYMITSTFYRQNNYHPIYALSNSLDLFIQIPFFIAAYHFLHNLELLNGQKFKFIADLGSPDGLLWGLNIFPIFMTLINCVSGAIYAKGLWLKDKIQLYGIALVFLVLLYNSPAALVLYWTCNNIYNLVKNIILKNEKLKKTYIHVILLICLLIIYILLSSHEIGKFRRYALAILIGLTILFQYKKQIIKYFSKINIIKSITLENTGRIFTMSVIGIFLLVGLVIPSSLIASSVEEFSFIKPFSSPLPFIGITLLQSTGILLWLICIYFLFSKQVRTIMTFLFTIFLGIFIVNVFCFKINYGYMTPDLTFSNFHSVSVIYKITNIFVLLFTAVTVIFLFLIKKNKILLALQSILIISLLSYGITNIYKINKEFTKINVGGGGVTSINYNNFNKYYNFSKNGKNLLVIMLDKAVSGYVPFIFKEKPELLNSFRGFTYYPNTISFGQMTLHGLSGIFGGYYYTPLNRQNRKDEKFYDKLYESLQILPQIIAEQDFIVSVYKTHYIDNSNFNNYKNITGYNSYNYIPYYVNNVNPINLKNFYQTLYNNLIRFSLFKISPILLHPLIYNDGEYLSLFKTDNYSSLTINNYASLYLLPEITNITDDYNNYANILSNDLSHEPNFFQTPDYIPSDIITNKGTGPYSQEVFYHGNMASLLLIAKFLDFLKDNGVYENTRIVIVSDHGAMNIAPFPNSISFLDVDSWRLEASNCLLLVKDFNADFDLKTDNTFMTNADVPHIVMEGLTQKLINPFNGKEMFMEKDDGVTITTNSIWQPEKLIQEGIKPNEWLHVKDNIFDPANWTKVTVKD